MEKLKCCYCDFTTTEDDWNDHHSTPEEETEYLCPQCQEFLNFEDLEEPDEEDD